MGTHSFLFSVMTYDHASSPLQALAAVSSFTFARCTRNITFTVQWLADRGSRSPNIDCSDRFRHHSLPHWTLFFSLYLLSVLTSSFLSFVAQYTPLSGLLSFCAFCFERMYAAYGLASYPDLWGGWEI